MCFRAKSVRIRNRNFEVLMYSYPTVEVNRQEGAIQKSLLTSYDTWFRIIPATTPPLLDQAYRLRYQVYCIERNYEKPVKRTNQRETDSYDVRSVHSLLVNRMSGNIAGTVRLILPDPNSPASSFPIQRICSHPLLADPKLHLTASAAEISRFAISKEYRKVPHNDHLCEVCQTEGPTDRAQLIPCITLGLFKATLQMSFSLGISDWFAIMEPALLRLLSRFGIYLKPIGPLVDYHGMRQPCHAHVESLLASVRRERPDIWNFVTDQGRSLWGSSSFFTSY